MGLLLLSASLSDQLHLPDCIWHGKMQRRSVTFLTTSSSSLYVVLLGKYGRVAVTGGNLNQTFSTDLLMEANTVHCLDFFYYLTDALTNEKMEFGWKSDTETQVLGEVVSDPAPKWQQTRIEFRTSSAEEYKVSYGMKERRRHAIACRSGLD